jgi:hypothetical protein
VYEKHEVKVAVIIDGEVVNYAELDLDEYENDDRIALEHGIEFVKSKPQYLNKVVECGEGLLFDVLMRSG